MGIVRESKTFLRKMEEIAIELVVFVFIMQHGNTVATGRQMEGERSMIAGNGETVVRVGLTVIFRPAIGRREYRAACYAFLIAETRHMDQQCARSASALKLVM